MKIEVGDKIRNEFTGNLGVVTEVEGLNVYFERCEDGIECITTVNFVAIIEKGEKKMKVYKGFEVIERMNQGGILQLTGDRDEAIYKIEGNFIGEKNKGDKHWVVSDMTLNYFLKNEFTEYKEPLKYKVGDEVWVKAKVIQIDEVNNNLPYQLDLGEDYTAWFEENEVKGIDE